MSEFREYKFNSVYDFADIIDKSVKNEIELFNFNKQYFLNGTTKFSKNTILHQYIVCQLLNTFLKDFRKNGDLYEEDMEGWHDLFSSYEIEVEEFDYENEELEAYDWYLKHEDEFYKLFDTMCDEIFHILFANRQFLLKFNNVITETVKEFDYPEEFLNTKGRIKRASYIPKWVKTAAYHRDKGRCVFCNTDLTGLINSLTKINYDHIVPLDRYGINDPSNIQLCCERCNKSKSNKEAETSYIYVSWWTRIKSKVISKT